MTIKKGDITIASSTPTTEWGSIDGTLSDQVDLKNALDRKAPTLSPSLTGVPTAPTAEQGTNTNQIATTKFVKTEINTAIEDIDALPSQTGQSGKFLTTDGTDASWGNIPSELPSQTGQAGKVLTTNGSTVSWTEYQSAPATDDETIHLNSSDELEVIGVVEKNAGAVKYDWVGTLAEWQAGRSDHSISDDWICYITDDFVGTTVSHNVGDIFYSLREEDMFNGAVVCDGSSYNIDDYSEGNESIKNLLDNDKLPYVSIETFNATVASKGSCRCFGYDGSATTTFKVPKLNDVFVEAGTANTANEFIDAGLPNITGTFGNTTRFSASDMASRTSGVFSFTNQNSPAQYGSNTDVGGYVSFDASQSNSIYGNSNTVQPKSVKYRAFIQLASGTTDSALQTVNSIVSNVNDLQDAMEETVNYGNITNCITKIPQDIKLELNNGTLTLKAGSKVYVPDGFESDGTTPHFNVLIIEEDMSKDYSGWGTQKRLCTLSTHSGSLALEAYELDKQSASGSIAPSVTYTWMTWYDTGNNLMKYSGDSGSTWLTGGTLPLGIFSGEDSSLDYVFNGFGYIGSTVFALPGVKGLVPAGRNANGTLKNIEFTTNNVLIRTNGNYNFDGVYVMARNNISAYGQVDLVYSEKENLLLFNNQKVQGYSFSFYKQNSGVITSLTPKTIFHALDWNDKGTIAGWGMPSGKYTELTVGTSVASYVAPATGWFCVGGYSTALGGYVDLASDTNFTEYTFQGWGQSHWGRGFIPVVKGATVRLGYSNFTFSYFRFVYAEGEV